MKKVAVISTIVLAVLAVFAAAMPVTSQPPTPPSLEQLRQDAGGEVEITWNPLTDTPSFIRGRIPLSTVGLDSQAKPSTAAIAFVDRYASLLGVRQASRELKVVRDEVDALGMRHVTLQQVDQGIEVYGGSIKVHLSADGREVVALSSGFVPKIALSDTQPRITAEEAVANAFRALPNGRLVSEPKLVVYPGEKPSGPSARLAWLVELRDEALPARNIYVIDAVEGTILDILDRLYKQLTGQSNSQRAQADQVITNTIISDGRFVYPSAKVNALLNMFPTSLKELKVTDIDGNQVPVAELFNITGDIYGVAPEVLLTLAEMDSHALTEYNVESGLSQLYCMGRTALSNADIRQQIEWVAKTLSAGFYAHYMGEFKDTATLQDGTIVDLRGAENAGTYALLLYFAQTRATKEEWLRAVGVKKGSFYQTFTELFGNPLEGVLHAPHPTTADLSSMPELSLIWPVGDRWNFTGGPHNNDGSGNPPLAGVDYQPVGVSGCNPQIITDRWIVAPAGGKTVNSTNYWLKIDHDGDGNVSTGWQTTYLHIANQIPDGQEVQRGDHLGHPSCLGGVATGVHVHFAIKFQNVFQPIAETETMLSGWTIHNGAEAYHGTMTRDGDPLSPRESCYRPGGGWDCSRAEIAHSQNDPDDYRVIRSGDNLTGTVNPSTDTDYYFFYADGGQRATIRMTKLTPSLDPYLVLYAPDGSEVARDDDSGGNRNALINQVTLPQTGRYRIEAKSYTGSSTGSYSLSLTLRQPGQPDRRTYEARHGYTLPGTLARSEGQGPTGDRDIDNAHDFAGATYDYYWNTHRRDSYDNRGATLVSTANYGRSYQNAFWNGEQTVYGDYFPVKDVVAHEWTHAVIEYSANLEYRWQSGALNESFADIFGAMVDRDDWLMGEDLPPYILGGREAIRDLSNPPRFGQPDHTRHWVETCSDNEGVHTNGGITNKAYYNIATAIGKDKAERIFYRALTVYLRSNSSLEDARAAALQSAQDLYGANSAEYNAVRNGFNAVGLDGQWNPPPNDCTCAATLALSDEAVYPDRVSALEVAATLYRVRDQLLTGTTAGEHYRKLYEQHTGRISWLLLLNSGLRATGGQILKAVTPGLNHLMDGQGEQDIITQKLVNDVLSFLQRLAEEDRAKGGSELADTIERERARIEWDRLVGMTYEEAWQYIQSRVTVVYPFVIYLPMIQK